MNPSLSERLKRAREILEEGDEFRILTHYDVDGVCSAGIVAHYLLKRSKRFHISFFRNANQEELLETAKNEKYAIITDMGSSFVSQLEGNVIVLDHHKPRGDSEKVVHINPHIFGLDGTKDACASTLAFMLTEEKETLRFFLAGIFGDKQYLDGISGYNKEIFEKHSLKISKNIVLHGNVADAIVYSTEPFFFGLSGNYSNVENMLRGIGIDPSSSFEELGEEEKTKLISLLVINLLENSEIPEAGRMLYDYDVEYEGSAREMAELIDAAARTDNQGIALSYILGSKESLSKMEVLRKEYKSDVIEAVEDMLKNKFEKEHLQYFYVKSSYLTGTVSTIASLYLLNPNKAVIAIYLDKMAHISAKCSRKLAERIHLGDLLNSLAPEFGGHGGGHSVAAGATIEADKVEKFLDALDAEIGRVLSAR